MKSTRIHRCTHTVRSISHLKRSRLDCETGFTMKVKHSSSKSFFLETPAVQLESPLSYLAVKTNSFTVSLWSPHCSCVLCVLMIWQRCNAANDMTGYVCKAAAATAAEPNQVWTEHWVWLLSHNLMIWTLGIKQEGVLKQSFSTAGASGRRLLSLRSHNPQSATATATVSDTTLARANASTLSIMSSKSIIELNVPYKINAQCFLY